MKNLIQIATNMCSKHSPKRVLERERERLSLSDNYKQHFLTTAFIVSVCFNVSEYYTCLLFTAL